MVEQQTINTLRRTGSPALSRRLFTIAVITLSLVSCATAPNLRTKRLHQPTQFANASSSDVALQTGGCDELIGEKCFPISTIFPFESRYVDVLESQMHFVEVGEGNPIVFVHGNPTWSYLWRNILPYAGQEGRAIAVDLIGMGRSGKPDIDYRFKDHQAYFEAFMDSLELNQVTLVVHDWGSGIGLDWARRHPDRVERLIMMEAALGTYPDWESFPDTARTLFQTFRKEGAGQKLLMEDNIFIEQLLFGSVLRGLKEEEKEQYRKPFPTAESRKPIWQFTNEVPVAGNPRETAAAINAYVSWLQNTEIPKLLLHVDRGSLTPPNRVAWAKNNLPNLYTVNLKTGGHFMQEEHPHRIGQELIKWLHELEN